LQVVVPDVVVVVGPVVQHPLLLQPTFSHQVSEIQDHMPLEAKELPNQT
jgi:hypothetical protein